MPIDLSPQRRCALLRALQGYYLEHFDEPLSDFRAEGMLDFFVRELGPAAYNQGVRDAQAYLQEKLTDLDGEVYERETPA